MSDCPCPAEEKALDGVLQGCSRGDETQGLKASIRSIELHLAKQNGLIPRLVEEVDGIRQDIRELRDYVQSRITKLEEDHDSHVVELASYKEERSKMDVVQAEVKGLWRARQGLIWGILVFIASVVAGAIIQGVLKGGIF